MGRIIWLDSIDSTNNEVLRRVAELDNLSVIAAKDQTAGRGQRGNSWVVRPGENLTFSMLLKGTIVPAKDQFAISEASTLAVYYYLLSKGVETKIKWPNDIYWRDKKICGMLIENALEGDMVGRSVIGIGLNMNQKIFPPQLLNPISLSQITGKEYSLEPELEDLYKLLLEKLSMVGSEEGRKALREEYVKHLYRLGEDHEYTDCATGEVFKGKIKGISNEAKLIVETPEETCREFSFKEVSYIL